MINYVTTKKRKKARWEPGEISSLAEVWKERYFCCKHRKTVGKALTFGSMCAKFKGTKNLRLGTGMRFCRSRGKTCSDGAESLPEWKKYGNEPEYQ